MSASTRPLRCVLSIRNWRWIAGFEDVHVRAIIGSSLRRCLDRDTALPLMATCHRSRSTSLTPRLTGPGAAWRMTPLGHLPTTSRSAKSAENQTDSRRLPTKACRAPWVGHRSAPRILPRRVGLAAIVRRDCASLEGAIDVVAATPLDSSRRARGDPRLPAVPRVCGTLNP